MQPVSSLDDYLGHTRTRGQHLDRPIYKAPQPPKAQAQALGLSSNWRWSFGSVPELVGSASPPVEALHRWGGVRRLRHVPLVTPGFSAEVLRVPKPYENMVNKDDHERPSLPGDDHEKQHNEVQLSDHVRRDREGREV